MFGHLCVVMSWDLAHTGVSSKSYINQYSQHEAVLIYEECFSHDWKGSTQNYQRHCWTFVSFRTSRNNAWGGLDV